MSADPELLSLVRAVLVNAGRVSWDGAWDKRGTEGKILSQGPDGRGTGNIVVNQYDDSFVPLSQPLGDGTLGQTESSGTELGTSGPYRGVFVALCVKCPGARPVATGRRGRAAVSRLMGHAGPCVRLDRTRAIRPAHRARATRG
jgi:hypothetical protein